MVKGERATTGPFREFRDAATRAEGEGVVNSLALINRAAHTDWHAAAWLLEHRWPELYGRSVMRVEHSGSVEVTGVPVEVLSELRSAIKAVFPNDPTAPKRLADELKARKEARVMKQLPPGRPPA
jgi:hypothetical protein